MGFERQAKNQHPTEISVSKLVLAGSVEATRSGHKIIAEFLRDKVLLRIPNIRSVLKLRKAHFPGAASVLKAIARQAIT